MCVLAMIHYCKGVRVCSLRTLGGFSIWNTSSLRIIFLKKKIRKEEDCEIISYIYNLAVVDARDYLIQCLVFSRCSGKLLKCCLSHLVIYSKKMSHQVQDLTN